MAACCARIVKRKQTERSDMTYRRTSRCRYCYEAGHNQRSCPKMKEAAAANPNSYIADKVAAYKHRACSYCNEPGHNKKTCKTFFTDYAEAIKRNALYRKQILEKMCKAGLGVGALLEFRYNSDECALIEKIEWDNITYLERSDIIKLTCDKWTRYPIKLEKFTNDSYSDYYVIMLSGISEKSVLEQVPQDWLSGKSSVIDEKFKLNTKK